MRHASFFHENGVYIDGTLRLLEGVDAIRDAAATYPKHDVEIKKLLSGDGVVMVERVDHFELSGRPFHVDIVGVFEIDGDRRITRWRDYYDLKSVTDPTVCQATNLVVRELREFRPDAAPLDW